MSPFFVSGPVSSPAAAVVPAHAPAVVLATPAVLLLFNRLDTTRALFAAIRQAQPARLYVATDGLRPDRPADRAACTAARAEVANIDWPCQVQILFQDRNLSCGVGPAKAINWFFSQEEEGIILEDDCVPAPDCFRFCAKLLAAAGVFGHPTHQVHHVMWHPRVVRFRLRSRKDRRRRAGNACIFL